jgi:hypothetical protein
VKQRKNWENHKPGWQSHILPWKSRPSYRNLTVDTSRLVGECNNQRPESLFGIESETNKQTNVKRKLHVGPGTINPRFEAKNALGAT